MSDWKDRYDGRPGAVLGGGPSLPEDMSKLPEGCVLIAVNHHALRLCEPDFMVYNDRPVDGLELAEAVKTTRAVKVSPDASSDIEFDVDVWTGFYSSNTAAWFASWLGCDPVILCGMDCYQGDAVYFHPVEGDAPCWHYPLDHHIRPWVEDARNVCRNPERMRAMSGPLTGVFGKYEPTVAMG